MKKSKQLISKLRRSPKEIDPETTVADSRVTTETVSRHREEVLSRGRRFKYPFQRSRHRVALTSLSLVFIGLVLLSGITSWQLYRRQSTSDFTYRVTQILPFPAAKVNGSYTSYESYLFVLKSPLNWIQKFGTTDINSPDGKRQISQLKYDALNVAMQNTIAHKLANKNHITVSNKEIDAGIASIKTDGGNLQQIISDQYGLTQSELRRFIKDNILKQKVAKKLDTNAKKKADLILKELKSGQSFAAVAQKSSDDLTTKQLGGDLGVVERDHVNLPPEVADALFKLEPGSISDVISTSSDYYIVTVTERVDANRIKASIIRVNVKDMSQYLAEYEKQGKVTKYIKLEPATTQVQK